MPHFTPPMIPIPSTTLGVSDAHRIYLYYSGRTASSASNLTHAAAHPAAAPSNLSMPSVDHHDQHALNMLCDPFARLGSHSPVPAFTLGGPVSPLPEEEVATFLRFTPHGPKRKLGDWDPSLVNRAPGTPVVPRLSDLLVAVQPAPRDNRAVIDNLTILASGRVSVRPPTYYLPSAPADIVDRPYHMPGYRHPPDLQHVQRGFTYTQVSAIDRQAIPRVPHIPRLDWICPEHWCGYDNFARNTECRDCGHRRPGSIDLAVPRLRRPSPPARAPPPLGSEGDWRCLGCGFMNWLRREACIRCWPDHPSNIDVQARRSQRQRDRPQWAIGNEDN